MVSEKREAHVVVVVHFGAVKTYKGKWGFSNNFDGSRLFINDNFDAMLLFKQKFLAKLAASTESSSHAGSYMMCSPKKVVVVGTIVAIVSDKIWYYDGCNICKSKVEQKFESYDKDDGTSDVRDEKLYQCSNKDCNGKEVFPLSRFKIQVRFQDSTGTVTLTLFDHEALKFVGKTAKELIQIQDELLKSNEIPREYPVEFESLVNLKCAFVIKVSDFNIVNAVENYGISVVTTDDDILDKLNKKFKIDQLDVSDSFGISQSEFQTTGGECFKDYVGDLKQSSSDMKRNLDDVYLNEEGLGSSAIDEAKYRRWLRKLYLDNKKSKSTALSDYFVRALKNHKMSGNNVGSRTYIPRISMIPSDKKIPFKFQRRQFPISICFPMTINKSQGQSLSRVGLYLRDTMFSHGQLYVAFSRVKTKDGVKVLRLYKDGRTTNKTANVVYKEIFGKL
ncbi:uncharacterized protein LOC110888653 [Helianthus annuus]|uniref:uncharacterized protein LOC110888653 n=1 Tax=Helianthus annuus TaxID=4232 RepID=UPI000B8EF938|nr:uncharacterized protein LOC110888653 [Helianthus annuus]